MIPSLLQDNFSDRITADTSHSILKATHLPEEVNFPYTAISLSFSKIGIKTWHTGLSMDSWDT